MARAASSSRRNEKQEDSLAAAAAERSCVGDRRWLNTVETARWLGLPVRAVQRLTSSKRIPHVKLGHRTILFDRQALDEWLEAQVAVSAADAISRLASDPRREEIILDALARRRPRSRPRR